MTRYTYQNDFEMIYLRHDYVKRSDIDPQYIKDFSDIIKKTSHIMFRKFNQSFTKIGFEVEDIESIASMYTMCYFSLYNSDDKPMMKQKSHLVNFLRQKLQYCALCCDRKLKNIVVSKNSSSYFAETEFSVEASEENILSNHIGLGYREVSVKEYKQARKRAGYSQTLYDENGFKIIEIVEHTSSISELDYKLISGHFGRDMYQTPEDIVTEVQSNREFEINLQKFNEYDSKKKRSVLRGFIKQNKDNPKYKTELTAARKMLKCI